MVKQTLRVRHNIEVAHRLSLLPGKCEQIHGHSMWVVVELTGAVTPSGVVLGLEFGEVKKAFRDWLDTNFDHHLLLNVNDQYAKLDLPGLRACAGDPTTENISRWIGEWTAAQFPKGLEHVKCEVWETQVNSATWEADV